MGQVGIVRRDGAYFREYAIEAGDTLSTICLRFGHFDWRAVYDQPANNDFRARFPDPDVINYDSSVHLFIPLVGTLKRGVRVRGALIASYIGMRVKNEDGKSLPGVELYLITPGQPHSGQPFLTNSNGEIIVPNPIAGDWFVASAEYELMLAAAGSQSFTVEDMATIRRSGSLPDPNNDLGLQRNSLTEIVARRVFYIVCPFCGITFKMVKEPKGGSKNICSNDGFDFTTLEAEIEAEIEAIEDGDNTTPKSFTNPATGQDPQVTPNDLKCRGTRQEATVHGTVTVFWDESRFVFPNGDDYTLWGKLASGSVKSVSIIGRAIWEAAPPEFSLLPPPAAPNPPATRRVYEFHETLQGTTTYYPYDRMAIPSNEILPLSNVLKWITIHHTDHSYPARNSYLTVTKLQYDFQTKGVQGSPAADIAYHYVIDADGSIYEGRPLGIKGSHVPLFNGGNIGIALAGDFEHIGEATPTPQALTSLDDLVDVLAARFQVKSVWSHMERKKQAQQKPDTACPGVRLIPHVNTLRSTYPGPPP